MKTKLFSLLALVGCFALGGAIVSCGEPSSPNEDNTNPDPNIPDNGGEGEGEGENQGPVEGEAKTFIFEAEYTDVSSLVGAGISGAAVGPDMIVEAPAASNEFAVGYLHREGITITYEINSSIETTAKLTLGLGNELGASMEFNKDNFIIKVNGSALNYRKFTLKADDVKPGYEFFDYKINSTINLKEGKNVFTFTVGHNDYLNGSSGGPVFDCIKLETTSELTWTPLEDNI